MAFMTLTLFYMDFMGKGLYQVCDVSMLAVMGEPSKARVIPDLGFCLVDSTFALPQVAPLLFMGSVVQISQSVTAYKV
ncbi:Solute carrier family 45 member 3 [Fukomys damarensis]|uniref:Solute carrier family 45 member 3 n=1 Tax=Fukomys damarensis TaxID=885580 RepID=A0A091DJD6_FUKDA|nr:Solute carrier family 45 member 3 [Fukomys damarensis]